MSSDELAEFWVHQVLVQTYLGRTGRGAELYADPIAVNGFLSRRRRQVRGANGDQVLSESSFSADIGYRDTFPPGTRVIFDTHGDPFGVDTFGAGDFGGADENGVATTVITVAVSDSGTLDLPDRVKAYLQ